MLLYQLYGIVNLNLNIILGSAYLFIVNSYFIALGASIILSIFRIPMNEEMTEDEWKKARNSMITNTLIILIPAIIETLYRLFA